MKKVNVVLLASVAAVMGTAGLYQAHAQFEGPPYRIDAGSSPMHMSPVIPASDKSAHKSSSHKVTHYHRTALNKHAHHARVSKQRDDMPHNASDYPSDLNDYERMDNVRSKP